ncbi:universal stress protein [Halovulum sp. GXIMD14794]
MTIASLLTIVRPDVPDETLTESFTMCQGGHLMVLVVSQAPPAPASAYDMVNSDVWLEASQEARDWASSRAEEIEGLLARRDQNGEVSAHVAGPVHLTDLVASASRCTDMVLLPVVADRDRGLDRSVLNGALFESGTPVLTYPADSQPKAQADTAIIAWNATPEGGRAVRAAMPLLMKAKRVIALLIDPEPGTRGHGADPGVDLARYLGHHGLSAEILKLPSEGKPVEEVLARQVTEQGADLLVMGAYGHSRLRERIFGGTTHAILEQPPCPVLLAH